MRTDLVEDLGAFQHTRKRNYRRFRLKRQVAGDGERSVRKRDVVKRPTVRTELHELSRFLNSDNGVEGRLEELEYPDPAEE